MSILRVGPLLLMIPLLLVPQACTDSGSTKKGPEYKVIPEIRDVRPEKPVRIKLRRNAKGGYSWELSGEDVDRIIKIDKKLRDSVNEERAVRRRHR